MNFQLSLTVNFDTEAELIQSARAISEVARLRGGVVVAQSLNSYYGPQFGEQVYDPQPKNTATIGSDGDAGSGAGGEAGTASTTSTTRRRRKPAAAADVAPPAESPKADTPATTPAAEPDYGAAGDGEETLAFDGDTETGPEASWQDVVAVLNQLHAKGFDKAKGVLTACGVARAADLKAEDQGKKRGEVYRAAQRALEVA